eukprot:6531801-Heterocapsa_arctica.AAC.1
MGWLAAVIVLAIFTIFANMSETREFDAQIQVLDIPSETKSGYSPIGFVRCGRLRRVLRAVRQGLKLGFHENSKSRIKVA